jgi:hypothetical protein
MNYLDVLTQARQSDKYEIPVFKLLSFMLYHGLFNFIPTTCFVSNRGLFRCEESLLF